jgi:hypothetical protein
MLAVVSAVAQLFGWSGCIIVAMKAIKTLWQRLPPWAKLLLILLAVPGSIAIARVVLEAHFSKLTAMLILIAILMILSLPLMFKSRGDKK